MIKGGPRPCRPILRIATSSLTIVNKLVAWARDFPNPASPLLLETAASLFAAARYYSDFIVKDHLRPGVAFGLAQGDGFC